MRSIRLAHVAASILAMLLLSSCGGGSVEDDGDDFAEGIFYPDAKLAATISNITRFTTTRVQRILIRSVRLMNDKFVSDPRVLRAMKVNSTVTFSVPVQDYFGQLPRTDVTSARMTVETLTATDDRPYRLTYVEKGPNGIQNTLVVRSLFIHSCASPDDPLNPAAECVLYSFEVIKNNIVQSSMSGPMDLNKTLRHDLVYLSPLAR